MGGEIAAGTTPGGTGQAVIGATVTATHSTLRRSNPAALLRDFRLYALLMCVGMLAKLIAEGYP